jgi:hypothetical protein
VVAATVEPEAVFGQLDNHTLKATSSETAMTYRYSLEIGMYA